MRYIAPTLLFVCILGVFGIVSAQIPQTNVDVKILPLIPGPNEVVNVSVVSYGTNVNTAKITWKINDKTIKSGIGEKSFSFTTGEMNTTIKLKIVIETQEGEKIEKNFSVKPASVDLIWESRGFVPPFYKGKSLFSYQNNITVTALPHISSDEGGEIEAENLVYRWKIDGSAVDEVSGFGKNSYTFVSSLISRTVDVEVEVTTLDGTGAASNYIDLTPTDPSILFYKKDPIYGIEFQKALQNTVGLNTSKEVVVIGIPLFFGTSDSSAPELIYNWSINGSRINNAQNLPIQVFRQKEGTSGTSNISLSIENDNKILQYASNSFNLMFGK